MSASELWLQAHAENDADRDAMWDWLEAKYLAAEAMLNATLAQPVHLENRELRERVAELEARRDAWVHEAVTNKNRARAAEADRDLLAGALNTITKRVTELERRLELADWHYRELQARNTELEAALRWIETQTGSLTILQIARAALAGDGGGA